MTIESIDFPESSSDCVESCKCEENDYNPICIEELGLNFYSACAAGCTQTTVDPVTKKVAFKGCSCIKKQIISNTMGLSMGHPLLSQTYPDLSAIKGECASNDADCYSGFYIFTVVIVVITFFLSSGRVGALLLQLRAIETEDKVNSSRYSVHRLTIYSFRQWHWLWHRPP